jgi:hypothetical protein
VGQGDPDKDCPFKYKSSASDVGKPFSRLMWKVALGSPFVDDEALCLLAVEERSIVGACAALWSAQDTRNAGHDSEQREGLNERKPVLKS